MKEISEMLVLFSLICLALGNALPIHCKPNNEKKEEAEDKENLEQFDENVANITCDGTEGKGQNGGIKECKILITGCTNGDSDDELKLFREYFGTKERARKSLLATMECFIIFYITIGYILAMDQEVPEVLFVVGLVALGLKFFF